MASLAASENGQGRIRTADTRIFSPLLYQLSYLPVRPFGLPFKKPNLAEKIDIARKFKQRQTILVQEILLGRNL